MQIKFSKYHALGNDFVVIEQRHVSLTKARLSRLAMSICSRQTGVGADGILYVSRGNRNTSVAVVFNADGSWAEKSGNGLRIVGYHLHCRQKNRNSFKIVMNRFEHRVDIGGKFGGGLIIKTELGRPEFLRKLIPVRGRSKFLINSTLVIGGQEFPVTCLAVGNPHTVLLVDGFDFDWQELGAQIERHRVFPNGTNVEFVQVVNRKRLKVVEWERGAGATGSSGTGAAASVCATVMLGVADRKCTVEFTEGQMTVDWDTEADVVHISGPVSHICDGIYDF